MKVNGGNVVASGSYGCVFIPELKCKNSKKTLKKGKSYISKLQIKKHGIFEYKQIQTLKKLLSKIPNYNDYFLLDVTLCEPDVISKKDLHLFDKKCGTLYENGINSKNINQKLDKLNILIMQNGGETLDDFYSKYENNHHILKQLLLSLFKLKNNAILPMVKLGIVNTDIKTNNVLIIFENGQYYVRIIDWGLSVIHSGYINEIPETMQNNMFQFNVPFSVIILSNSFKRDYESFILSLKSKQTYDNIYQFVIKYLIDTINKGNIGQLNVINYIFYQLFFKKINETSKNYESYDNTLENKLYIKILYDYTLKYICKYITEILLHFTSNGVLDLLFYYKNVFIKNADLWGYYILFFDLFYKKLPINSLQEIILTLLNYSHTTINDKIMDKKTYECYKLL
jgi:hypothetical protein